MNYNINVMKLILILFTFIISVYIFPVCYVIHHSHNHAHHIDEHCQTCIEIFSIVKAVSKILRFCNIYNSVIIYLAVLCIFLLAQEKEYLTPMTVR